MMTMTQKASGNIFSSKPGIIQFVFVFFQQSQVSLASAMARQSAFVGPPLGQSLPSMQNHPSSVFFVSFSSIFSFLLPFVFLFRSTFTFKYSLCNACFCIKVSISLRFGRNTHMYVYFSWIIMFVDQSIGPRLAHPRSIPLLVLDSVKLPHLPMHALFHRQCLLYLGLWLHPFHLVVSLDRLDYPELYLR